jgi:hypothetical protein
VTLTFADLCTATDAAGVEVRVVLTEDERHVVSLLDFHGLRSLDLQVQRGFDAAAIVACCSHDELGPLPPEPRLGAQRELAATAVEPPDVGVSDGGRPERLSYESMSAPVGPTT